MIEYVFTSANISAAQLEGFFENWADPPSRETHLELLRSSDEIVLAIEGSSGHVVGFITAITDRVLSAYIPLLEVLPEYRGRGIGRALVRHMLERLDSLYMVDLLCDPELQPFYADLGMLPATGMMIRNYRRQSGAGLSAPEQDGGEQPG